jgi:putative membrane protein
MKIINLGATIVAFAALAMMSSSSATAQNSMAGSSTMHQDSAFAKDAASGGAAEVKLGELAQQKGTNDSVKQFGKRMETDHTAAGDKLKDVASKDGMTLPNGMSQEDQAEYDRLSKLSGHEFDQAYAQAMVQDHQKDISAFQHEANSGMNPDLKNFASETLPTLQDHLRMAQDMQKNVGGH